MRAAEYNRTTMDVDLMVADDAENEARFFPRFPLCRIMPCASFSEGTAKNTTSSA